MRSFILILLIILITNTALGQTKTPTGPTPTVQNTPTPTATFANVVEFYSNRCCSSETGMVGYGETCEEPVHICSLDGHCTTGIFTFCAGHDNTNISSDSKLSNDINFGIQDGNVQGISYPPSPDFGTCFAGVNAGLKCAFTTEGLDCPASTCENSGFEGGGSASDKFTHGLDCSGSGAYGFSAGNLNAGAPFKYTETRGYLTFNTEALVGNLAANEVVHRAEFVLLPELIPNCYDSGGCGYFSSFFQFNYIPASDFGDGCNNCAGYGLECFGYPNPGATPAYEASAEKCPMDPNDRPVDGNPCEINAMVVNTPVPFELHNTSGINLDATTYAMVRIGGGAPVSCGAGSSTCLMSGSMPSSYLRLEIATVTPTFTPTSSENTPVSLPTWTPTPDVEGRQDCPCFGDEGGTCPQGFSVLQDKDYYSP